MITNIAITFLAIGVIMALLYTKREIERLDRLYHNIDRKEYNSRLLEIETLLFDPPRKQQSDTGQYSIDGQEVEVGDVITLDYVASFDHASKRYIAYHPDEDEEYAVESVYFRGKDYFILKPQNNCAGMSFDFGRADYVKGIRIVKKADKDGKN